MVGQCDVVGDCVSSSNYPSQHGMQESCAVTILEDVDVIVGATFELETCCDHLVIGEEDVESPEAVPSTMYADSVFTWSSDFSVAGQGWQLCFTAAANPGSSSTSNVGPTDAPVDNGIFLAQFMTNIYYT